MRRTINVLCSLLLCVSALPLFCTSQGLDIKSNMSISSLAPWVVVVLAGFIAHRYISSVKRHRKFPPGPKPLPLIGNTFDFPPKFAVPYLHWLKHKDLYGPISSVTAFGDTVVIIHDREAAQMILEKQASLTSGRLVITLLSVTPVRGLTYIIFAGLRRYLEQISVDLTDSSARSNTIAPFVVIEKLSIRKSERSLPRRGSILVRPSK